MNTISPTAQIDPAAQMGDGNFIGPFCYIGPNVTLGDNNTLVSHVVIGTAAQHRAETHQTGVHIGNGNVFREFVTVHQGTEELPTIIGNDGYFMKGAHVAHDCVIEDDVTLCNDANLAGHCYVMEGATLGLGVQVHQYQVIGSYVMLGMGSVVTKQDLVAPGETWAGNPACYLGANGIGLFRHKVTADLLEQEARRWEALRL